MCVESGGNGNRKMNKTYCVMSVVSVAWGGGVGLADRTRFGGGLFLAGIFTNYAWL